MELLMNDLLKLKSFLGENFKSANLFGSIVNESLHQANDIDVAIRTNNPVQKEKVQQFISDTLSLGTHNVSFNEYGGPGRKEALSLAYDFVFVDDNHADGYFMNVNRDNLVKVL